MAKDFDFQELFADIENSMSYAEETALLEFTESMLKMMKQNSISQAELARKMGCSPAYITKILRGSTNFTLVSMVKIAYVLGCTLELNLKQNDAARLNITRQYNSFTKPDRSFFHSPSDFNVVCQSYDQKKLTNHQSEVSNDSLSIAS